MVINVERGLQLAGVLLLGLLSQVHIHLVLQFQSILDQNLVSVHNLGLHNRLFDPLLEHEVLLQVLPGQVLAGPGFLHEQVQLFVFALDAFSFQLAHVGVEAVVARAEALLLGHGGQVRHEVGLHGRVEERVGRVLVEGERALVVVEVADRVDRWEGVHAVELRHPMQLRVALLVDRCQTQSSVVAAGLLEKRIDVWQQIALLLLDFLDQFGLQF